ncbi:MAG: hypothetical protein NTV51_03885 [Verrucomicrobia bacterium]|nr:hypothetical protein [Verrucomicrobiota bacterium]
MAYTADDLITEVRQSGAIPTATALGTLDADILRAADDEVRGVLLPELVRVREEFYERRLDTTIAASATGMRIPDRAVGSVLRTVEWLNTSGSAPLKLERLEPERVQWFASQANPTGNPWAFYLQGSRIMLVPVPQQSGTLRVRFMQRPGRLQLASTCRQLTTVAVGATTTVLTWTSGGTLGATPTVDVIKGTPSFETAASGVVASAGGATSVTVTNASFIDGDTPEVGDWVAPYDTSPVVQLPVELQPAVFQSTTARLLKNLGRVQESQDAYAVAQDLLKQALLILTPRTQGNPRRIVGTWMWNRGGGFWGGGR